MTMTTLKVSTVTRDRLKAQAAAARRSLGAYLEELADLADRRERFASLRRSIDETPPEALESYRAEVSEWDGAADGFGDS